MGRERILVREKKLDPDTCPIIVGAIKKTTPRIQHVKPKERIKVKTSRGKLPTNRGISTCEVFGNVMKLCVNLMPALASAQEPEQSESKDNPQKQGKKEGGETFFRREKKTTAGNNIDSSGSTLKQKIINTSDSFSGLSLNRAAVTKQPRRPSMLPPKPQSLSLPVCWDKIQRFPKPLPPIGCSETTIPPYLTAKIDEVDEGLTGQLMDSKFWMDNILFSKSTSAEFRLPDISLSGLDDLLETVTQKLKRKKRRGEGPVQSDHLLMAKHRKSCVLEKRIGLLSGLSNV
ncbi:uncharacterized protein LOC107990035 [Cynoglossus semilaevis]|uniref:uncharacterized protein LOC107990035 n=1 Tax=Cynoglossus semilaevis TaxID=244447 RepID=UPI0007DC9013|nr:uncharacterized protein LOC107990035 [Cynoglossus semilaevis]